jgi:hypothetical protein
MSNYAQAPYYARAPLGQTAAPVTPPTTPSTAIQLASPSMMALRVASVAAMGALAYHGYRRSNSWGWALAWGIGGGIVWPIALAVAVAQGFGKPAAMRRNRKRSRR